MAYLATNPDNETDGGTLELDGVSAIVSADVGGFTYVFVAGGVDDGISVFRLNANGTLTPVFDLTDDATLRLDGARGLSTAMVDGNTYLFAVGEVDDGVSVFRVNTNGTLTGVANVSDDATLKLDQASDTATARVGANSYLFVAGQADDGISTFRIAGDGRLTSIGSLADGGSLELDGVRTLATCVIGGNAFLIAGGGFDDGISVFAVSAAGALTNTNNLSDDGTLELDGVSDIATAVVGGVTYVFVSGADDSGVSVFALNSSGILTGVANQTDSTSTLIAGANSLSVATIGGINYLTVGGTENGLSLFRIGVGGGLTFVQSFTDADNLAHELSGTVTTHAANVGGTTYMIDGGAADDGVSVFGSRVIGQLFFTTQEPGTDARIAYVGSNGFGQTVLVDSSPTLDLVTYYPQEVGLDTAAGLYFAVATNGIADHAYLLRGSLGSGAAPTIVVDFPDDIIVNTIQVDAINHKIYACYQDGNGTNGNITGIRIYAYNPLTGAVTDQGFLTTAATDNRANESGYFVLDPHDFALDASIGRLFYTEKLDGLVEGLYRLDLANPNVATQLVSQAQFPDSGSAGYFYDVEVDTVTDLVYFTTQSQYPFPDAGYSASESALWYISENASSGTATQVTLTGLPAGHHFYPGDMSFDQATRQLYIESGESFEGAAASNNVIYVFQLNLAGTSASLVNSINAAPQFFQDYGQFGGLTFAQLASLGPLGGTATAILEQGAGVVLLTGAPSITDGDGQYLAYATVQITGATFNADDGNSVDDNLGYGVAMMQSGVVAGTNVTVSFNHATDTLLLSGYDTIANYQAILSAVVFQASVDNPTNYGLNPTRTITWTVSDGSLNIPAGSQNSGTTTITIAAVNDAPVTIAPGAISGDEDSPAVVIDGLRVTDPDTNPALTDITATLSVQHGVLTLDTAVVLGLTVGDVTGNGTSALTVTATLNEINATLSAASGLVYTPSANFNGSDTLHVVSNDGGNTGTGGALIDTDDYAITVTALPDSLVGTPDPDLLDASLGGFDSVSGLASNDVLYYGAALTAANQNDGGAGALDELALQGNYALMLGASNLVNIERLALLSGSVTTYGDLAGASYAYDIATVEANVASGQQLVVEGHTLKAGESLTFDGSAETDGGRFVIYGGLGADTLEGGTGGDTLNGGGGADMQVGLGGDDTYYVDNAGDVVIEGAGEGTNDRVFASVSYALAAGVQVERLVTTNAAGTDPINLTGNELGNIIQGNAGANVLNGGSAADALIGFGGNDTYYVDNAGDSVVEGASEGTNDRVLASVSYTLATGVFVEQLATINSLATTAINLNGNELANLITGNAGANVLNGKAGVDTMIGLGGDDTYHVDSAADVVIEGAGEGTNDRVFASVSYALGAGVQVELLGTIDSAATTAINLTGNALANALTGNGGGNVLDGAAGADTMTGLGGDDTYYVDNAGDAVVEGSGQGINDRVLASVSYTLGAGVQVERLVPTSIAGTGAINFTGNELANIIYGNAGNNVLDGAANTDALIGLGGDDTYYVDNIGDSLTEGAAEGTNDRAFASVSYTLGAGVYVERLATIDSLATTAINLTGNELANVLTGNAGANVLNGKAGADTLIGLGGNDTYHVDNAADVVTEGAAEGANDRVFASVSYALGAGVHAELLATIDNAATTAINLTGNALANALLGNAGANVLDGGAGIDTMTGLGGDDWYYIDNAGDVAVEGAGQGTADRIFASVSYTLGAGVQVEKLTTNSNTATTAINLTGNEFGNQIYGNAGANVLDGKGGADTLFGLAGADTFAFTTALGPGNVDAISDFVVADDTIQLENAVFTGLAAGALAAGAFNTGAASTQADDRVIYNSATGALLFDADGLGGVAAVQFATVSAGLALTSADFLVI